MPLICCVLVIVSSSSASGSKSLVTSIGTPLVFHTAGCEDDGEVIKINNCSAVNKTECEDVVIPSQKMEYTIHCMNITATYCTSYTTVIRADPGNGSDLVEPLSPLLPSLQSSCVETEQEYCYQEPLVTVINTTVTRCLVGIIHCIQPYHSPSIYR